MSEEQQPPIEPLPYNAAGFEEALRTMKALRERGCQLFNVSVKGEKK